MRQIMPQGMLKSYRDPGMPRQMVTENSCWLPKPSEWHKFAADYSDDEE
jgi:hypothetical protein